MNLRKTSESVSRSYDEAGNASDRIDNVQYQIIHEDVAIGNVSIHPGSAGVNISLNSFSTIEEGEAKVKEILNIND